MERARSAVEGLGISHAPGARLPILTVSVGMASVEPRVEHSVRDAIARADEALYTAKADGGNAVRSAAGAE
jgi:PleD family two-component response regulator